MMGVALTLLLVGGGIIYLKNHPFSGTQVEPSNIHSNGGRNGNPGIAIRPTEGAAGVGTDPHGIKKIYQSAGKIPDWYMTDLNSDKRVKISGTTKNLGNGIFEGHVTAADHPASFRINVSAKGGDLTSTGEGSYQQQLAAGGADFATLAKRGYMMSPQEWKNVEMTIYWNCKTNSMDEMSLYARGGGHGHGWPIACLGNCYKCQIRLTGEPRFAKEYYHEGSTGYVFLPGTKKFSIGSVQNKWIGQKAIIKDLPGGKGVRMETWCDTQGGMNPSAQNWKLMATLDDTGNLPPKPLIVKSCKATSPNQIISWSGPMATFRIDLNVVDVKWASIREIKPY